MSNPNVGSSNGSGEMDSSHEGRNRGAMTLEAIREQKLREELDKIKEQRRQIQEMIRKTEESLGYSSEDQGDSTSGLEPSDEFEPAGADSTPPTPPETPPETPAGSDSTPPETPDSEQAPPVPNPGELSPKAKKNHAFKGFLVGVIATITVGGITNNYLNNRPAPVPTETTQDSGQEYEQADFESLTGYDVLDRTIDGSFLQYDNIGCYNAEGKVNPNSVGNPDKILEAMGVNPEEATAEQRGKAQEYLAYSMEEVAACVAIAGELEGFGNLSQVEAEAMIHDMSPEEKSEFQGDLDWLFDNTEYHYENGEGSYWNQSIVENGEEKQSHFVESDLTGKQILVGVIDIGKDAPVTIYFKEDCGNFVATIIKPSGEIIEIIRPIPPVPPESESQSESQSETNPPETNPPETNPPETNPPETNPPETNPAPKNSENLSRIDKNPGSVTVTPTPSSSLPKETTPQPVSSGATAPNTVRNNSAPEATPVQPAAPANNTSQNLGGANVSQPAPVQENKPAQAAADKAEIPIEQAPTGGEALDDALSSDFGIN